MKRRTSDRGLVMSGGRKIPRTDAPRPKKPPVVVDDEMLDPDVAKAASEIVLASTAIRTCEACPRASAERAFGTGFPRAPVMLVKERPSKQDLERGCAFSSEADALTRAFDALGIPVAWTYGTTAVRCGGDEADLDDVKACSGHLLTELEAVAPKVVVLFGSRAVDALRSLDGRCGLSVPDPLPHGEAVEVRPGLVALATEPLPDGVTVRDAKKRLWRDLKEIPAWLDR